MGNLTNYVSGGEESPGFSVTFSINGCRLCKGGWGVCPEKERGRGTCSFTNKLKSKNTEVLFPAFWAPARSQA